MRGCAHLWKGRASAPSPMRKGRSGTGRRLLPATFINFASLRKAVSRATWGWQGVVVRRRVQVEQRATARRKAGMMVDLEAEYQFGGLGKQTKSAHVRRKFHCLGAFSASPAYSILKKNVSPKFRADVIETSPSYPFPIFSESGILFWMLGGSPNLQRLCVPTGEPAVTPAAFDIAANCELLKFPGDLRVTKESARIAIKASATMVL